MAQINRWDLIQGAHKANTGAKEAKVAGNRRSSDKYHANKLLPKLPGTGRSNTLSKLARRSNNGNMPGHGVGGVPGNGFGGGIPSLHKLTGGLLKNHKAMTLPKVGQGFSNPGGSDRVNPTKLAKAPFFKPAKPLPIRKIPPPPPVRQPKVKDTVPLGPLKSAATTRPNFAK